MASKRLIGILTVRHGRLCKSYGYAAWRPAGDLTTALRNLDRWSADEIVVLDISRRPGLDPAVLRQIADAKVATPLAYGGGIRGVADVEQLMALGCDRFVVESVLYEDPVTLQNIADLAGHQALIGSIPLCRTPGGWALWRPYPPAEGANFESLDAILRHVARQPVSEYFVTAVGTEGRAGGFPLELVDALRGLPESSVIWFGGLDCATASHCLREPVTAAVAFGNLLHDSELALPHLRAELPTGTVRPVRLSA
ncbi:MAG TPA: HisA/HisF-related TIM barrel protein [Lacunisphaera sp.]|nr:HisA/HisF-related TIM barrel protein [Lacunisphaera sp.]